MPSARTGVDGVWRMIVFLVGLVFVLAGAIALPLPIPFGALMFVVGFAMIVMSSKRVRTWFHAWRLRSPRLDGLLSRFEHWLPGVLRRALDPRERRR